MTQQKTTSGSGRKALGRGLGALIPGKAATERRDYFACPIARIRRTPDQPRQHFDEDALRELSESIAASGLIQPLVVRQDGADYRLIAGERRLRAVTLLGLETVPVVIKDVSPDEAFEIALVENIQRQDLNPVEEALAYERLMKDRGYTQDQLAARVGKSRSAVANTLRLLKLETAIQARVASGELSGGAARALLSLPDPAAQADVADVAVQQSLTVRQLESVARRVRDGNAVAQAVGAELSGDAPVAPRATKPRVARTDWAPTEDERMRRKELGDQLSLNLGAPAIIRSRGTGGSIEIRFRDGDALDKLLAKLAAE
jgi:ParB family transcriptional regulator, chromosome partitioning protein